MNLANLKKTDPSWDLLLKVQLSWKIKLKIIESSIEMIEETKSRSKFRNNNFDACSKVGMFERRGLSKTVNE